MKTNTKLNNIVNMKRDDTHRISGNIVKIKSTMTVICDASSTFSLTAKAKTDNQIHLIYIALNIFDSFFGLHVQKKSRLHTISYKS